MKTSDLALSSKKYFLYEKGIRPKSYKAIISAVSRLVKFSKTEEIKDLNTNAIRDFLYYGREDLLWSSKTFRNMRQCLASYFNFCVKFGYIKKNPTDDIDKPKLPKALPRSLNQQEAEVILATALNFDWRYERERLRNYAMLMFMVCSGVRLSELLALEMRDIDMYSKSILVRNGKGQKDRIIPMVGKLYRVLKLYIETHKKHCSPLNPLFCGARSEKMLTSKNVQVICTKISKHAGIKFTPHMLRHTFARQWVESDKNLFKLMQCMGHADLSTTQRYLVFRAFNFLK